MTCTEEYKEHIEYTFQAFCKVVIRNAAITAARTRSRKYKREISLEYLTDEKHYPLGTAGKDFRAPEPDEEYIIQLCGDTVILNNGLLVEALSRLPVWKQEMVYLSYFRRIPQREIGHHTGHHRRAGSGQCCFTALWAVHTFFGSCGWTSRQRRRGLYHTDATCGDIQVPLHN